MLLRNFAQNERTLQVVSRTNPSESHRESVDKAAAESGFYNIPAGDVEPEAGRQHDPESIEAALSTVEGFTKPILSRIAQGTGLVEERDKFQLSLFVALQVTRGWQYRSMVRQLATRMAKQFYNPCEGTVRASVREYLASIARPNNPEEVTNFINTVRQSGWMLDPGKTFLVQESMSQACSVLSPILFSRPLRVFRFERPSLLTSDAAVGLWAPDGSEPRSAGVLDARGVFMAINRYTALGFMSTGEDRDIAGSPFWARHINLSIADRAHSWIYHHPDDNPLADIALPPPATLKTVVDSATLTYKGEIKVSGRHVWR